MNDLFVLVGTMLGTASCRNRSAYFIQYPPLRSLDHVLRTGVHILALIIALVSFTHGEAGARSLSVTTLTSHSGSYLQFQSGTEINQVVQIRNGKNLQFFTTDSLHLPLNQNASNQSEVFIFPTNDSVGVPSFLSESSNSGRNSQMSSQTKNGVSRQDADILIRVHDWESVQIDEGKSKQFHISLRAEPSSDVEISISQFTITGLSHNQSTPLTFTSSNYKNPQAVTVTAAQDDNTVHESERITLTASGAEYDGMTKSFPVQVLDDDVSGPRIMMDPPKSLSLNDAHPDQNRGFRVWLSEEPDSDVTVMIAPFDNPDITIRSSPTLIFTPQNYSKRQAVVIGVELDDEIDDESAHTLLTASGGGYDGVSQPYRITIIDEGIVLPEIRINYDWWNSRDLSAFTVKEDSSNTVEFSLGELPHQSKSIVSLEWYTGKHPYYSPGWECAQPPASIVSFHPSTLTFTPFNYRSKQVVTVTALEDDNAVDETLCIALKKDETPVFFAGPIRVLVDDNDNVGRAEILVNPRPERRKVNEGRSITLSVKLRGKPVGDVRVEISPFDNPDLTHSRPVLKFTKDNYSSSKLLPVRSVIDETADHEYGEITLKAFGGGYDDVTKTVRVNIRDLDVRKIIAEDTIVVQEGKTYPQEFGIILGTEPTGPVKVSISRKEAGPDDLTLTPESVNFTPQPISDWNDWKWIEMTAAVDPDWKDDKIPLTLTATDSDYDGMTKDVLIIIKDPDPVPSPAIVLTPATVNVDEASDATFEVTLSVEPTELVKVNIPVFQTNGLSHDQPDSLEFTPGNFDDPQTVAVTSEEDANSISESEEIELSATGGEYDGESATLTVNVIDNDSDGLILPSLNQITITEGKSSDELTVRLSQAPTGSVTVTIARETSSNLDEPDPMTIDFDASDYGSPIPIRLNAPSDNNLINSPPETLTLTASGGGYDGVDTTITLNFEDPDKPEITAPSSLTIPEGQSIPLSISLSNQPSANVDVTISGTVGTDLSSNTTTLTFTDETWDIDQEVTLVADEDDDTVDDPVTLTLTASNGGYNGISKDIAVNIDDKDDPVSTPSIHLTVSPNPVTEGNTTRLTVTLSEAVSTPTVIQLDYDHIDTEPSDYTPLSSLTIDAGEVSSSGDLRILDDEIAEPDETFRIRLRQPQGIDLGTPSSIVVTIEDDADTAPPTEVILSVDRSSVLEGESVTVTTTLHEALSQDVTIPLDYPTDGITAEANRDYTPLTELTIAAGQTTQSGTIPTLVDALQEDEETFTVALGALPPEVVGGRVLSHTITIVDQHPLPEVSLSVDRNPMDEGETTTITVTLLSPLSDDATIPVTLTPVTASREDVEVLTSLSPVIAGGDTEAQVSIRAVNDDFIEGSETFTVALGSLPSTVVEGRPSAIDITITDTDDARLDAPPSVVILEGDQETIQVSLTAIPSSEVSVAITGHEDADLGVSSTTLVFSPDRWNQAQEVILTAGQDDDFSPDQISLLMTASGGEYSGVTHTLEVTIIDGNQPGLVVPSSMVIGEGSSESFDVRLAQQPTDAVTVLISGTTGTDLVLQSPSVLNFSVSDWDQPQLVELMAEDDSDADPDPPVQLILSASGGGYDGVSETVTITIQENDQIGMVVEPTSLRIAEGDSDALSVYLTAQPSANVSVDVSGHETSDLKMSSPSVTFTLSDWEIPQDITLEADTDLDTDNDEITLTVRATGGGYSGLQEEVQVTIVDQGFPEITIYDAQAKEEDGIIRLPVELSHTTNQVVTVQYSSTDETATAAEDYTSSRGIVIFDPGGTRGIVQFELINDAKIEDTETFTVTLANATHAEIVRSSATATIIDDDGGAPTIAIYDAVGSDDAGLMMFEVVLSEPSPHAITVGYRTEDGTATAGQDYAASTGQVTFAPGVVQTTIDVPLLSKETNWQEEMFFVHLEVSESVQIEKDVATAVIQQPTQVQKNALAAYTARFVRTLSVQLTEAIQERLHPSGSTCSAMHRAETAQLWHGTSNWTPSLGELLSGCRISKIDTTSSGRMGFWGRGSFRRFHGRDTDALTLRGDVSTAMIGTDYRWNAGWLAGMMVAYSQGSGTYRYPDQDGEIETHITGIYPYVSYEASEWEIWMSGGYGWGSAEVQDGKQDLASRFGAVGFQGDLASVRTSRLRYYGDVLLTDADIEEHQSEVIRVRLGMESAFHISEWIHPYVEANVRQDGGDAETGISLELGGGLRVAYPEWKLHGEVRSQGLVLHSADGFMEWGISGSIQIGHPSEGLMMRIRPSWGPSHQRSLYRQQTILDATPLRSAMHRTEVELGYGIPVRRGTARSIVGVTQLPKGRLLRLGGQLNPWDWVSFSLSGLLHQHHSSSGNMSLHVQASVRH